MREFFKQQLKNLHITTGLQQWAKLQEMTEGKEQATLLIDGLVDMCNYFTLIPDVDKQKIISEAMFSDPEFIGFNKKIIWKWLSRENHKFFPNQAMYKEPDTTPVSPERADYWLKEWTKALEQVGNVVVNPEKIKDWRVRQLKKQFELIKCSHPLWIETGENEYRCNACGAYREPSESSLIK